MSSIAIESNRTSWFGGTDKKQTRINERSSSDRSGKGHVSTLGYRPENVFSNFHAFFGAHELETQSEIDDAWWQLMAIHVMLGSHNCPVDAPAPAPARTQATATQRMLLATERCHQLS